MTNLTNPENTEIDCFNSFDSNGFSLGTNGGVNYNGNDFVAWSWKAGGTAVSNTDGTITSTVSANPNAGFSIVTYTGNLSSATTATGASVGHGLSSPPELIIFKNRSSTSGWQINSAELTNWSTRLQFDTAAANNLYSSYPIADPTSTVFYTNYTSAQNVNTDNHIAYCFHSVDGYQKVGSYTGNRPTDVSVNVGFAPRFVMIKCDAAGEDWIIIDSVRGDEVAYPNKNLVEAYTGVSLTSAGFEVHNTGLANTSGATHIYLAIA